MTILQSVLQLEVANFVNISVLCIIHAVVGKTAVGNVVEDSLKGRLTDPCRWDCSEVCKFRNKNLVQLYFDSAMV